MNYKTLAWCHLRAIRSMSEVVIVKHDRVVKLMCMAWEWKSTYEEVLP